MLDNQIYHKTLGFLLIKHILLLSEMLFFDEL